MIQTVNHQEDSLILKAKLFAFYEYLIGQKDLETAEKVKQLGKKLIDGEFTIAFCGHFSAGKSTMINTVIGEKLLPSSPIPTSANLVKVKSGEEYAKVFFKKEKPRMYLAPYDYEMVKNFCKDGDQIEEIEISRSQSILPDHTVIMDTPGIDSADDAHRLATESAIHLADLVFYVMDYNHVQAELNFLFTKELTEAGKEVYLVINQIDKHREDELGIEEFKKSVDLSFASWGVNPARIFYTSLKESGNKLNEFAELKSFIHEKLVNKNEFLVNSVYHSMKKLAHDHLLMKKAQEETLFVSLSDQLKILSEDERVNLKNRFEEVKNELHTLDEGPKKELQIFEEKIAGILNNAYLMPFQTRALAEGFLEACQQEFKVGFLFSRQKTQDEKRLRLNRFYEDILEKTKSQIEWHLREYLIATLKENELNNSELESFAQSFSIPFQTELLENAVKAGARLSGDYVLNYTEDVSAEIKKIAKLQLNGFKELFLEALQKKNSILKIKSEKELSELTDFVGAYEKLSSMKEREKQRKEKVHLFLTQRQEINHSELSKAFYLDSEEVEIVRGGMQLNEAAKQVETSKIEIQTSFNVGSSERNQTDRIPAAVARMKAASALVKDLPGFKKISAQLMDKAERLENKGFTVALFGAFSAGKSSFANALIGEKVLPVSPNPTTAAINKIKPVTADRQHGTVLVKFKASDAMLEDLNRSLHIFDETAKDFKEGLLKIDKILLQVNQESRMEKTHLAFLQAFKKGFASFEDELGTIAEKNKFEFADFVAHEEKSCFVEWIELYYDCELTRKGISLVDTPGADSINARHTGVAFDYIKNADAVLFVTYYNHAFSKADREFLIQLGRVKESFQLDKMFFIINAVDLAEDDEEKDSVTAYVQEQLIKYGIRNPHLYPLSSLMALEEKSKNESLGKSGMPQFEHDFYDFIQTGLTELAIISAEDELSLLQGRVRKLIESSQDDQVVKDKKRSNIDGEKKALSQFLKDERPQFLQNRLKQEADELIYYIKQRVFLRFSDFFKEAFNPAVLKDDGRNLKKALHSALEDLLDSLGFDFAQEMRATTLRLERFMEKLLKEYHAELEKRCMEITGNLSFSDYQFQFDKDIDFQPAFDHINRQMFSKALSSFKNPRSFFEKNEKKYMIEELFNLLQVAAEDYLKQESIRILSVFEQGLNEAFIRLMESLHDQADEYYLSLLSALDGGMELEQLLQIEKQF